MIVATTSGAYTATINTGQSGLVGTIALQVSDVDGNIITAPSTANILELLDDVGDPTGEYVAHRVAPGPLGSYVVLWSTDGSFDPETVADEDMTVVSGAVTPVLPPIPTPPGPGPVEGPCQSWITSQDVADCCSVDVGSDVSVFDTAAVAASMLLFELSGRKFSGICSLKVRPCGQPCSGWSLVGWPSQAQYWGWNGGGLGGWGGWGWWGESGAAVCGCQPLSRVKLGGYPVVAVDEVKIDGVVLDPTDDDGDPTYRLDEWTFLTRLDKPGDPVGVRFWPSCQNLALDDDQPGTFAVTYRHGVAPPLPGTQAAAQLACEIYKACNGQECKLPAGATKVTRQGIEITRSLFLNWGLQSHARGGINPGTWSTGLTLVDVFLNAYARYGATRRSAFWSPDLQQYARRVGAG